MASLILNIFPVCNNAAEFHKIHPSSSRHGAMQKSEPLNSAMFKSVSGGFTRASFIKNPKCYFISPIMLFCETYQSTNLDSLKLLSFYFTIFVTRDSFFL